MAKNTRGKTLTGPYATLFSRTLTGLLVALAHEPGAREADLCPVLGLDHTSFQQRIKRLKAMKLVVGDYFYEINSKVEHVVLLHALLLAIGAASGITRQRSKVSTLPVRGAPAVAALPKKLFGSEHTTSLLLFLASIGESFPREMSETLKIEGLQVHQALKALTAAKVVAMRRCKQSTLYSLDTTQPAYEELHALLRGMAGIRKATANAVTAALVRRERLRFLGSRREVAVAEELAASLPARMIPGVQATIGERVHKQLMGQTRAALKVGVVPRRRFLIKNGAFAGRIYTKTRRS